MLNRFYSSYPILTTERLTLRQLAITDDQEIFKLCSDKAINKYLNRETSNSIDDARIFIKRINENIDKHIALYWAICLRDRNMMVGTICLYGFSEERSSCEIGFELLQDFQRQAIMKEAAEKVIDYAFNTIQVQRIDAYLHKDNQSSIKLLEKLSFLNSNKIDEIHTNLISYHLSNSNDLLDKPLEII
ncbi:MAG: GNAT family N-acetyltransferase [Chitinophagaceae bacterium BSSC1]|nr:MAG: GNAT family N-acetyltransferase [Chitinophagaceae bacterium BSSC1]